MVVFKMIKDHLDIFKICIVLHNTFPPELCDG